MKNDNIPGNKTAIAATVIGRKPAEEIAVFAQYAKRKKIIILPSPYKSTHYTRHLK